ncbi:Pentatricopeptide repeat [Dillenia turbinata]|uniref:Pentatricopeptide repeat n=1 Tax=Dillenia turbinata TaxID=194707 RepID=A0AAN8WGL1_9MAGN
MVPPDYAKNCPWMPQEALSQAKQSSTKSIPSETQQTDKWARYCVPDSCLHEIWFVLSRSTASLQYFAIWVSLQRLHLGFVDIFPCSADPYSFTAALAACRKLGLLQLGMSIQSMMVKHGLEFRVFVVNCSIDMYGKCGSVEEAIWVFYEMTDRDIVSFNSVISACARIRGLEEAFGFLNQMPCPDTISYNELINGRAQFRCIEDALGFCQLFLSQIHLHGIQS